MTVAVVPGAKDGVAPRLYIADARRPKAAARTLLALLETSSSADEE